MISKEISSKVLVVGTDIEGQGGMAILLKSYSAIFEQFNFVCTHRFASRLTQLYIAVKAVFEVLYYCIFRDIKIVHIHTASYRSFYRESIYLLIAKLFRKKVILHLHGGEFEIFYGNNKHYCDYICRKADVIVGVSHFFGDIFKRLELNKNIIVLYNIAEKPLYTKQVVNKTKLDILFLGAIDDNKGIFDVLGMWAANSNELSDKFNLTICGIGDDKRLTKYITSQKLSSNITYLGWVDKARKNELLSHTDIYIQPSHFESLGIAIIEALSYGVPVIASNTGGIPELIEEGVNGHLIEVGNMRQLKDRLLIFFNNKHILADYSENAKGKASKFFSENIEYKITDTYKTLL